MSAADLAIYAELANTLCACGAPKSGRQTFCRRDYFRLPVGLRAALYERDGYCDTYRRAVAHLGLQEPAARVESAPGAAISESPSTTPGAAGSLV